MYIRTGDMVEVLSGTEKGKRGKVTAVERKKGRIIIQGLNLAMKHIKRGHPKAPQGGRIEIEKPMHACKVALIDPVTDKPTRIGYRYLADGTKERYAKKSGASLGIVSPAKKAYAQKVETPS